MLSLALCSDVLAIRCLKKHVCIGIGNSVHVYCIATGELVAKLCALESDNIHDIVRGTGDKLIVYGGKSLRICELKFAGDTAAFGSCSALQRFADWIIAVDSSHDPEIHTLCILFAHNNLGLYDPINEQTRGVWCQEKCILYGGSLLLENNRETVVFAGTVFQEILIWRVKHDRMYTEGSPVLHRLSGHKGVIFSVIYDRALRTISSTSDDRTIRLWRVTNKAGDESNDVDWCNSEIDLTTTMYGHTARVWRSLVKNNRIISIGEDSLMCTWSFDGRLLDKVEAHHGAEIWSIDVTEDGESIFTGGADGAVNVWHFEPTEPPRVATVFDNDDLSTIPKYVCYMNSGNILVMMDGGILVGYDTDFKELQRLSVSSIYQGYRIMELSPDRKKIVVGSRNGCATIYEENEDTNLWKLDKIMEDKVVESTILSSHWLTNDTILVCGNSGVLKLVDVSANGAKRFRTEFVLPASRERWTTAAIVVGDLLICGDRAGTIYAFDLVKGGAGPAQIFSKIHGRLGVQFLSLSGDKVLSTGRDGTLRFYENLRNDGQQYLQTLHAKKMPMDWVCRILEFDGDIYVLGFKEVEFVVFSMKLKRFVRRFVCGGGHRSWDCKIFGGAIKFVYIKDKKVCEIDCFLRNTAPGIINGCHTREIYCFEPIATSGGHDIVVSAGEDSTIRVNCIVRDKLRTDRLDVTSLGTYDGHISNVKTIAVKNIENSDKSTRNLVFSGGGRAQLKIWEIRMKFDEKKKLTSHDLTCRELLSYMLHGSDKDRRKILTNVKTGFFADPETRFMDMSAQIYHEDTNFVVLFVACSDGVLRILLYDIVGNNLRLSHVVNGDCNRCTLKVHAFLHKIDTVLLSMTTDGIVGFWRVTENIANLVRNSRNYVESERASHPFAKMKIHQNGINSYDFRSIDESRYLLLTGGDDNLMSLVYFEISSTKDVFSVRTLSNWESSSVHCAQITGAKFVDNNRIITAGIDQRVVVHSYTIVDEVLTVSQIDEINTFVPDVQGVTVCCTTKRDGATLACVYGKGFEVIALKK